jgi:hypothetical protein
VKKCKPALLAGKALATLCGKQCRPRDQHSIKRREQWHTQTVVDL